MPKMKLSRVFTHSGHHYGPGEVEVPDDVAKDLEAAEKRMTARDKQGDLGGGRLKIDGSITTVPPNAEGSMPDVTQASPDEAVRKLVEHQVKDGRVLTPGEKLQLDSQKAQAGAEQATTTPKREERKVRSGD